MRAPRSTMPARRVAASRGGRERLSLETIASEFALLAQRRGRLQRQIDLLARQSEAACANLGRVELRMQALTTRMGVAATAPAPLPSVAADPAMPPPVPKARAPRGALLEY